MDYRVLEEFKALINVKRAEIPANVPDARGLGFWPSMQHGPAAVDRCASIATNVATLCQNLLTKAPMVSLMTEAQEVVDWLLRI